MMVIVTDLDDVGSLCSFSFFSLSLNVHGHDDDPMRLMVSCMMTLIVIIVGNTVVISDVYFATFLIPPEMWWTAAVALKLCVLPLPWVPSAP